MISSSRMKRKIVLLADRMLHIHMFLCCKYAALSARFPYLHDHILFEIQRQLIDVVNKNNLFCIIWIHNTYMLNICLRKIRFWYHFKSGLINQNHFDGTEYMQPLFSKNFSTNLCQPSKNIQNCIQMGKLHPIFYKPQTLSTSYLQ